MVPALLVVEADAHARALLGELIQRRGLHLVEADGGASALELAAGRRFEVVLISMSLTGVDALALIGRLREWDPDQEIILLSTRAEAPTALTALQTGLAGYLMKPLDEAVTRFAIDRCVERASLRRERARLLGENKDHERQRVTLERCQALQAQLDVEWLVDRLLAELTGVADCQSSALWLTDERGGLTLQGYRGLIDRATLPDRFDPSAGVAGRLREGAPWFADAAGGQVLYVPVRAAGELVGLAQLGDPLARTLNPGVLPEARLLAEFGGLALRNARHFAELQRLSLKDRDTPAYNLSYFVDLAGKEIAKARRYARTFSLVNVVVDNLPQARARLGGEETRRALGLVVAGLARAARDSDVLAKVSEEELMVLLPETDHFGATMFVRRAGQTLRDSTELSAIEARVPLGVVAGAATFPADGEDFDALVACCRREVQSRRTSLQRRLSLEPLSFWEEVELLLGGPDSPRLPFDEGAAPSHRGRVGESLFDEVQHEIGRELLRLPSGRALLYVGGPEVRADLPIIQMLDEAPAESAFRVYVLGRRRDLEAHGAVTAVYLEGDERLARCEFMLWIADRTAYALLQRRGRGAAWAFHTCDRAVVEGLVSKLQGEYDLQP